MGIGRFTAAHRLPAHENRDKRKARVQPVLEPIGWRRGDDCFPLIPAHSLGEREIRSSAVGFFRSRPPSKGIRYA